MGGREASAAVLLVRVGAIRCALPINAVVETMRPLPTEPVSGAPPFVRGLAVIRGRALPVVELARVLGGAAGAGDHATRYVVLRIADREVALAVDEVIEVVDSDQLHAVAMGELPPLLASADPVAVAAIGSLDAALLVVLDASRLLPDAAVRG